MLRQVHAGGINDSCEHVCWQERFLWLAVWPACFKQVWHASPPLAPPPPPLSLSVCLYKRCAIRLCQHRALSLWNSLFARDLTPTALIWLVLLSHACLCARKR